VNVAPNKYPVVWIYWDKVVKHDVVHAYDDAPAQEKSTQPKQYPLAEATVLFVENVLGDEM
jgi:hypothetical protein